MKHVFCVALIFVVIGVEACKKPSAGGEQSRAANAKLEPALPEEPPTVMFEITPANLRRESADSQLYDCTYTAGGRTARFQLEWKQSGPFSGDLPVAKAEGKFIAVEGSDNSVLLVDLEKALEAKEIPKKSLRIREVTFDAVVLGEHQSRDASGGFSDNPRGDWVLLKLFLPKGGDDGEVFLNINPVLGKAEFSIKDSDYGNYLMAQFAKVL